MSKTIGFVGLGGKGTAMAANLLKSGFASKVYNRADPLVTADSQKLRPHLAGGPEQHGPDAAGEPSP